jgi:hypothetical protein
MATVSGVPVSNIEKISSIDATNIVKISSIATANIPGWPSAGPSCTTIYLGYSDGRRQPPSDACLDTPQPYDYDPISGILYVNGFCGNPIVTAAAGFYSDGGTIYDYTNGTLQDWGPCER